MIDLNAYIASVKSSIGFPCADDCTEHSCNEKREAQKTFDVVAELALRYKELCK